MTELYIFGKCIIRIGNTVSRKYGSVGNVIRVDGFMLKTLYTYDRQYRKNLMYCLTKDRLGSTVMAKDTEGEVVSGIYYNAWGEPVSTYTRTEFEKSVLKNGEVFK